MRFMNFDRRAMSFSNVDRVVRSLLAASIVTLTACSSPNGNAGITPAAMRPSSVSSVPLGTPAKTQLYISDPGTNEVEVFGWPKPKTGSALSGSFSEPQGECADTKGDVFITNTGESNILEYTGTKLTSTIADSGEYPVGCSYDPKSGDLAVSNIITTGDGAGSVAIFKKAMGKPHIVKSAAISRFFSVAYDGSSDLFATGQASAGGSVLAEMTPGSKKFKIICNDSFGGTFPGGLAWDGKYIVVGNQDGETVSRIQNCKVVGTTQLLGSVDIVGFAIAGNRLIGPDAGGAAVEIYAYPKGGDPIQVLTGFSEPIGAAVAQDVKGK
jgi:hypothetical protein